MDPPPDPTSRYVHACRDCGLPLHEDQAACLNCGAMVEHPDGGAGIRRAALGSVTALLVLGMAVGAAAGGTSGALTDVGVDDRFMKELGTNLDEGGAAVIVLVRRSTPDKVIPRIREYGGHVIQTSLSEEAEESLRTALGEMVAA
jgi:uncharacterized membrane protein